jgi:hypothetical protein
MEPSHQGMVHDFQARWSSTMQLCWFRYTQAHIGHFLQRIHNCVSRGKPVTVDIHKLVTVWQFGSHFLFLFSIQMKWKPASQIPHYSSLICDARRRSNKSQSKKTKSCIDHTFLLKLWLTLPVPSMMHIGSLYQCQKNNRFSHRVIVPLSEKLVVQLLRKRSYCC